MSEQGWQGAGIGVISLPASPPRRTCPSRAPSRAAEEEEEERVTPRVPAARLRADGAGGEPCSPASHPTAAHRRPFAGRGGSALGGGRRLRGRARSFRGGGRSAARGRAKETAAGGGVGTDPHEKRRRKK